MRGTTSHDRWPRVTRRNPCPICNKPDWCLVSPDGAVALCMRIEAGSFLRDTLATGEPYALHQLHDTGWAPPPRPEPSSGPVEPAFDTITARAIYGLVARHGADAWPVEAEAELVRRFGAHATRVRTEFGIGYCAEGATLPDLLDTAERGKEAHRAGVLTAKGNVVSSLRGRLVIPYRRGGLVHDLRGAGLKAHGDSTKELSLPGAYAEREVDGLFFNHDALDTAQPGEVVHLAGGAWKTMALHLAGLRAIGTRGEAELSEAQLAALVAARVRVIVHADGEDPEEGQEVSAGRRLALAKAERAAAARVPVVGIAEPPHEPGTKTDADALLRDAGPALVRAYALSPLPLDAFRVLVGADAPGGARLADVERENAELRTANARLTAAATHHDIQVRQLQDRTVELEHEVLALRKCLQHGDHALAAPAYALAVEIVAAKKHGHTVTEGGRTYGRVYHSVAAERVGRSPDTIARLRDRFVQAGTLRQTTRKEKVCTPDRKTGEEREIQVDINYYDVDTSPTVLAIVNHLLTTPRQKDDRGRDKTHGGERTPRPTCQAHPDAGTIETVSTRKTTRCRECLTELETTVSPATIIHRDAEGNRLVPPAMPQDAALNTQDTVPQDAAWSPADPATQAPLWAPPAPPARGIPPVPQDAARSGACRVAGCGRHPSVGRTYCALHELAIADFGARGDGPPGQEAADD